MSTLSVSYITSPSNTTPLVLSSANSQAAFVRIEAANNDIVFNGFTKFLGGLSFSAINVAYDTINVAYASINSNWTVTNTVYGVANAAFASANNVGPQLAPAYNTANAAFGKANTALQNVSGTVFNGNLGISTVPNFPLDVNGLIHLYYSGGTGAGVWYDGQNYTNRFFLGCEPSGNTFRLWDASASTNRFLVDSSGNIGIGTTPWTKLAILSPTNAGIAVNDGTVNSIFYNTNSVNGSLGTTTDHPFAFYTNNAERMRISNSGNVSINITTQVWNEKLSVYNALNAVVGGFYSPSTSYTSSVVRAQTETGGTGYKLYEGRSAGGAVQYWVDGAGGGYFNGTLQFNSGYGSAQAAYGCRAWVNYQAQTTAGIRSSQGVTSITKNGTGDYTVNLSFTMPDVNYSYIVGISSYVGGTTLGATPMLNTTIADTESAPTTTSFRFATCVWNAGASGQDAKYLNIIVVR